MPLVSCYRCKRSVSDKAQHCPQCSLDKPGNYDFHRGKESEERRISALKSREQQVIHEEVNHLMRQSYLAITGYVLECPECRTSQIAEKWFQQPACRQCGMNYPVKCESTFCYHDSGFCLRAIQRCRWRAIVTRPDSREYGHGMQIYSDQPKWIVVCMLHMDKRCEKCGIIGLYGVDIKRERISEYSKDFIYKCADEDKCFQTVRRRLNKKCVVCGERLGFFERLLVRSGRCKDCESKNCVVYSI